MDETGTEIPERVVLFKGETNKIESTASTLSESYKALSIRCIKD